MKAGDIKKKTKAENKKQLDELRERLRVLRFDLIGGKVKNVREVRRIKKDIARILSIIGKEN